MSQQTVQFNRDTLAQWYAQQHLKTDLGITEVIYLPCEANDREVSLASRSTHRVSGQLSIPDLG